VYVPRAHGFVVRPVMVFAMIIGQIFLAGMPTDINVSRSYLIHDPKETHFHRARALFLYRIIRNAGGSGIVTVHGCWGLWMAELL
jgi:hypothetical protein